MIVVILGRVGTSISMSIVRRPLSVTGDPMEDKIFLVNCWFPDIKEPRNRQNQGEIKI